MVVSSVLTRDTGQETHMSGPAALHGRRMQALRCRRVAGVHAPGRAGTCTAADGSRRGSSHHRGGQGCGLGEGREVAQRKGEAHRLVHVDHRLLLLRSPRRGGQRQESHKRSAAHTRGVQHPTPSGARPTTAGSVRAARCSRGAATRSRRRCTAGQVAAGPSAAPASPRSGSVGR